MNREWQTYLENAGAVLDADRVASFGDPEAERAAVDSANLIIDLSGFGTIAVSGAEAEAFLQGQFINDVREVDHHHSQLNAYCSAKGRVLASFRLYRRDDTWHMRLPADTVSATLQRLRMFVLTSKAVLVDVSDRIIGIGCAGPEADSVLAASCGSVPEAVDGVVQTGALSILRVPGTYPRFEVYGPLPAAKNLWRQLSKDAKPVGSSVWKLLEIRAGIPSVVAATTDTFVPQMLNMQAIDGVSFRKGCYPGQEVVARMQYLGKLKRRMYRVHVTCDTQPQPGDNIYPLGAGAEQSVGKIVDAQPEPDGGYEALAVIQVSNASDELRLNVPDGPAVNILELPYAIEVEQT